jgi:soluble lytic murein transglycosylase-like protein
LRVSGLTLVFLLLMAGNVRAQESPRIGRLTMPPPWWEIVKDAAKKNGIGPYWIAAVMAIESRYNRFAINHRHKCYGLMQLQKDVAKGLGVMDPFDAEQNIRAGAAILGRLEKKYSGDKLKILKVYNPTDTGAYSREVMRAWRQARREGNFDGQIQARDPGKIQ